jgi:hypothetical protein
MTVIRANSLEALWGDVRTVSAMIKTARAKAQAALQTPPASPDTTPVEIHEGWYSVHQVQMPLQKSKNPQKPGTWRAHRLSDGSWCRGK